MYKRLISLALFVTTVLVCTIAIFALAAPAPATGIPAWDAKYSPVAESNQRTGVYYDRGNASGDKITSNAHSGDYPGVYFRWDDKQKMPGVFLVEDWVFDLFQGEVFYLTAKNSNSYYKYTISRATGVKKDGVWVYGIPKEVMAKDNKGNDKKDELKNINMVFIDGVYKDASFNIIKVWYDEDGVPIPPPTSSLDKLLSFSNGYKLGENIVKFTDYTSAVKGKSITVTENAIKGYDLIKTELNGVVVAKAAFTLKPGDKSNTVTFHNKKQWVKIEIVKIWLDADGNRITDPAIIALLNAEFKINGSDAFTGFVYNVKEGVYTVSEIEEAITAGYSLVSVKLNGASSCNPVRICASAGDNYVVTFTNKYEKITQYADIKLLKTVDGDIEWSAWFEGYDEAKQAELLAGISFKLYPVAAKGAPYSGSPVALGGLGLTNYVEWDFLGKPGVEPGWYAIAEVLEGLAATVFEQADVMYIHVTANGYDSSGSKIVSGSEYGALCETTGGSLFSGPFKLPEVWENQLGGVAEYQAMAEMGAKWIWAPTASGTDDTHRFGTLGSEVRFDFPVGVNEDTVVDINFAADNAAAIYVNGKLAAWTEIAFNGRAVPASITDDFDITAQNFFDKTFSGFDGGWGTGWCYAYSESITLAEGENIITVFAANSAWEPTGPNAAYNNETNPCGVIFGFVVPGESFNNKLRPIPASDRAVVPMVSAAGKDAVEVTTSWGLLVWPQGKGFNKFIAPGQYEDGAGFVNGPLDKEGAFVWNKIEAEVTNDNNIFGEDIALFKYVYDFTESDDPYNIEFTDFQIAADNEFALIVNGTVLCVSNNFKNIVTGVNWGSAAAVKAAFDLDFLAGFSDDFWALNNPNNNLYGRYGWYDIYTISAADILAAYLNSGDDSVVIEICAYNIPEISTPNPAAVEAGLGDGYGNPAMIIFSGSFTYEYDI